MPPVRLVPCSTAAVAPSRHAVRPVRPNAPLHKPNRRPPANLETSEPRPTALSRHARGRHDATAGHMGQNDVVHACPCPHRRRARRTHATQRPAPTFGIPSAERAIHTQRLRARRPATRARGPTPTRYAGAGGGPLACTGAVRTNAASLRRASSPLAGVPRPGRTGLARSFVRVAAQKAAHRVQAQPPPGRSLGGVVAPPALADQRATLANAIVAPSTAASSRADSSPPERGRLPSRSAVAARHVRRGESFRRALAVSGPPPPRVVC